MPASELAIDHISDDDLELDALKRLVGPDVAPIEEHLLVREECRARLADSDRYVRAMRAALKQDSPASSRSLP